MTLHTTHERPALLLVYFLYKCLHLVRKRLLSTLFYIWVFIFPIVFIILSDSLNDYSKIQSTMALLFFFLAFMIFTWFDKEDREDLRLILSEFFPLISGVRVDKVKSSLPSSTYLIWSWLKLFAFKSGFMGFQVLWLGFYFLLWFLLSSCSIFLMCVGVYFYGLFTLLIIPVCWECEYEVSRQQGYWEHDLQYYISELEYKSRLKEEDLKHDPRPYLIKDPTIPLPKKK